MDTQTALQIYRATEDPSPASVLEPADQALGRMVLIGSAVLTGMIVSGVRAKEAVALAFMAVAAIEITVAIADDKGIK